MANFPVLTSLILLPVLGALLIYLLTREGREADARRAKNIALGITILTFIASLVMILPHFNAETADYQFTENARWLAVGIRYRLGIDGISLWLVLLTTFLMPLCILSGWNGVSKRVREYLICFWCWKASLSACSVRWMPCCFTCFFEGMLIPMYLLIGIWGGDRRIYAAYKFFLYTLLGSVLFLLAILYLYFTFGTAYIPTLMERAPTLDLSVQRWLWLAMSASFAVKVPMWPVHTWLPDAHVQAPTAGSVILAGILLKMGGYGFLRFSLPMLPDASEYFAPLMWILSITAVVYTSLVALVQEDMKKLIAYSSVAHMGFVTAGLFAFNRIGIEGSIIQMLSHGLVSGALFICVGVLYDRLHTREISRYGGVTAITPRFAAMFLFSPWHPWGCR